MQLSKKFAKQIIFAIKSVVKKKSCSVHEPTLKGKELLNLKNCISTNFVSSVGPYVAKFEKKICNYTKSKYCIATSNGTTALHVALIVAGIKPNQEVLIPSLNYIASTNATLYCGAIPHFVDVEKKTFGIHIDKLESYLKKNTKKKNKNYINKNTNRVISAIIPTHIFGHPVEIKKMIKLSKKYNFKIIEDAAEAFGSFYNNKHAGTFGDIGILSFNGNKIVTAGAGGAIITQNKKYATLAKHLTTTAKNIDNYQISHDMIGYNYRLSNVNAAIGCAQIDQIKKFLKSKRKILKKYQQAFKSIPNVKIFVEPNNCKSNYWLQTLVLKNANSKFRDLIIATANKTGLSLRPVWKILTTISYLKNYPSMDVTNSKNLQKRIINLPSSSHIEI